MELLQAEEVECHHCGDPCDESIVSDDKVSGVFLAHRFLFICDSLVEHFGDFLIRSGVVGEVIEGRHIHDG